MTGRHVVPESIGKTALMPFGVPQQLIVSPETAPLGTRYDAPLIEFAQCVCGEIEIPYPYEHELLVQEVLLAACGNTNWSK